MFKTYSSSALLFLMAQPLAAFAQGGPPAQYWDWPGPWHMWGGMGFWWLFPLLMLGFIFLCVLFMVRGPWGGGHSAQSDTTSSALRLLNERFAKGEISKEEFEEKRTILGGGSRH